MFELTPSGIDRNALIGKLANRRAGALVVFEGWVRDHNQGKKVSSLEYQVYEALALKEGSKILAEAREKFNLHEIICTHRHGHLLLGDCAVWIGATATHRDDAFRATRYVIDEIKLRLPIWKKEHYVDEKAEWVFCKDHHTHVHFSESEYYQKQSKLVDQDRLRSARVLIVGAGGLGCPVLTALTMAGVGHIEVVDPDRVNLTNLQRQFLYTPEDIGEKKVIIAVQNLKRQNPFVQILGHDTYLSSSNVDDLIREKDLIIDCTDNLATKYLLHDACFRSGTPLISASIYQFEGQIRTFVPGKDGGCLRCVVDSTPEDSHLGNCNDFGVLGSSVNTIGSIEANEALLFLQAGTNNTIGKTFFMNLKTLSQMRIRNNQKADCPSCRGEFTRKEDELELTIDEMRKLDAIFIDVRNQDDSVLSEHVESGRPVIVCCHKGIRSRELVKRMRQEGHDHFYSLKGGACSL